ncbi:MAG TPA: head-tail connector protein [Tepidisphaeraceae bacterium]|jgi:uncharacterized phiE125 gp8 family phage protein|nr:head-tail connector protein [Tepidisphaeraceae bacterium]
MPIVLDPIQSGDVPEGANGRHTKWSVTTPPTTTPVSAGDAGYYLNLNEGGVDETFPLELMVAAAVEHAEDVMGTSLMPRTMLATFYNGAPLLLPRGPLLEMIGVADGNENAVTDYKVEHVGRRRTYIVPAAGLTYPVSITYRAGYANAAAVPADIKLAILAHVGTLYENRESVSDKPKTPVPHSLEAFYRRKGRNVGIG